MSMKVWGIKHAPLHNWAFHHWGLNGSTYIEGKKVDIFGISMKWMIDKCAGCSWVRWEWGIWDFFKRFGKHGWY